MSLLRALIVGPCVMAGALGLLLCVVFALSSQLQLASFWLIVGLLAIRICPAVSRQ